jgi:hypothetical protein
VKRHKPALGMTNVTGLSPGGTKILDRIPSVVLYFRIMPPSMSMKYRDLCRGDQCGPSPKRTGSVTDSIFISFVFSLLTFSGDSLKTKLNLNFKRCNQNFTYLPRLSVRENDTKITTNIFHIFTLLVGEERNG